MSRTAIPFVKARKNFNSVHYFPFGNVPADSYVLTSDPWNFLKAYLKNEYDKIKRSTPKQGPVKERIGKAIYFIELAESFQKSADNIQLPTKATLTYYSALNVVKAFLLIRGHDLETAQEYHGLSLNSEDKTEITVSKVAKNGINIFHTFASELGFTANPSSKISLTEMVSNLPEIHELAFNLGLINKTKRKFLPVQVEFTSNENRWTRLSYRLSFKRKHKHDYRIEKFKNGILSQKLEFEKDEGEKVIYKSKQIRALTHKSDQSWNTNYQEFCKELNEINIRLILTRLGYKYYLDIQPDKYNSPIYYLVMVFYLGSIARYRPSLNEEIIKGEYNAIVAEVMNSSPKQFLYFMTGMMTNKVCAIPMANL